MEDQNIGNQKLCGMSFQEAIDFAKSKKFSDRDKFIDDDLMRRANREWKWLMWMDGQVAYIDYYDPPTCTLRNWFETSWLVAYDAAGEPLYVGQLGAFFSSADVDGAPPVRLHRSGRWLHNVEH